MTDQIVKSPCGAADLLAAIFGEDPDVLRAKYHLPLKHVTLPKCPICNKDVGKYGQCHRAHYVTLACDECGELFERKEKVVIWKYKCCYPKAPLGYQHQFCNRQCLGRWAGKHYGWGFHPENTGGRIKKGR